MIWLLQTKENMWSYAQVCGEMVLRNESIFWPLHGQPLTLETLCTRELRRKWNSQVKQWNKSKGFEWVSPKKPDTWYNELKPFILSVSFFFPQSSGRGIEAFGSWERSHRSCPRMRLWVLKYIFFHRLLKSSFVSLYNF